MRVIFMGSPDFAVPSLHALIAAGHEIVAVYSQPPRRSGRGKALTPTAVANAALRHGLIVRTPPTLRDPAVVEEMADLRADIAVVAAYGLILPPAVLAVPRLGCINVHGSVLPRWRGAAPVQRAILAGDTVTGVSIMDMAAGLDTGPVRATATIAIGRQTAGELTEQIARTGADLLITVIGDLAAYPPVAQAQDGVIYAPKIDKSEAAIDFMISAVQVERQVRAFAPMPGAFFTLSGERIRILAADVAAPSPVPHMPGTVIDDQLGIACNPGVIHPTIVQRAGKAAMPAEAMLRGFPIARGTRLS